MERNATRCLDAQASAANTASDPTTMTACPEDWPKPNHWKVGGRPSQLHAPPVIQRKDSRHTTMVAKVTTIDGAFT